MIPVRYFNETNQLMNILLRSIIRLVAGHETHMIPQAEVKYFWIQSSFRDIGKVF